MFRWFENRVFEDVTRAGKFDALDGIRGLAVLIVFLSHTSGRSIVIAPWLNFLGLGHVGVYLFFVLTAFMLTYSLIRRRVGLLDFYQRRFLRIFPLYALVICAVFSWQLHTGRVDPLYLGVKGGFPGFISHLIFLRGDSIFWTVAAEFQFYLVLPFIVWALLRWPRAGAIVTAVATLAYGLWYLGIIWWKVPAIYALKIARIAHAGQFVDVFLCGVLAAFAYENPSARAWLERHRTTVDRVTIAVFAVLLFATFAAISQHFLFFHRPLFKLRDFSLLYGIVFAAAILVTALGNPTFTRIFSFQPLRSIGVCAFGWYLLHMPIFQLVHWLAARIGFEAGLVKFLLAAFFLTIIATLAYVFIEKPFMALSKRGRTPATADGSLQRTTPI